MTRLSVCFIIGVVFLLGGLAGIMAFPINADVTSGYNLVSIFFILLGFSMIDFRELDKEKN